jgi:hypothetical protein
MALRRLLPMLAVVLAVATAWIVYAAVGDDRVSAALGATIVPLVLLAAAIRLDQPLWSLPAGRVRPEAAAVAAMRNTVLLALLYAWGGLTLLTAYPIARLTWYHWGQYGVAMLLVAALLAALARAGAARESSLRAPASRLLSLRLVMLHGLAAAGGVGWLLVSGKAASVRGDWLANVVFVAGGVTVAGLSALYVVTERRLTRPAA